MSIFSWIGNLIADAAHNRKLYKEGTANKSMVRGLDPQRGMSHDELKEYAKKLEHEKSGFQKIQRKD